MCISNILAKYDEPDGWRIFDSNAEEEEVDW